MTKPSRMWVSGATATWFPKGSKAWAVRPGRRWPLPSMPSSQKNRCPISPSASWPRKRFKKGKLADSTFAAAYSPWTVGYMAGSAAIKTLGKKKIFFLARADSWGWDIRDGVYAAAKEIGAKIVGYDEVSLGTNDFTTILQKVRAAKPDVFISAQFAADAVALLKQCHQMGLNKEMTIFNCLHHQRGRQRPSRPRPWRVSTRCIISTMT